MSTDGISAANPSLAASVSASRDVADPQSQGALKMVNSVPETPKNNEVTPSEKLPDNLGKNLNVVA